MNLICLLIGYAVGVVVSAEWMESGGDGKLHLICPRWERRSNRINDSISRQAAIDTIGNVPDYDDGMVWEALSHAQRDVALLPSVESEMIREIRKWINSNNRGRADYFIVDKIEEIINKYE